MEEERFVEFLHFLAKVLSAVAVVALIVFGFVVVFVLGLEILYDSSVPDAMPILGGSFLGAVALAALTFTMASALDVAKHAHPRAMLIRSGSLVSLGALLFMVALAIRYAVVLHKEAAWWKTVSLDVQNAGKILLVLVIAIPYEAAAILVCFGVILFGLACCECIEEP